MSEQQGSKTQPSQTWKNCSICDKLIEKDMGIVVEDEANADSFHICSPDCLKKLAEGFSD